MSHNVVIISAHPDDMEIGMGGTAAKLVESMAVITSVVITNGGRSSNPFALTEQRLAEVRREEALHAAGVLGVKDVIFCDEPDAADEINTPAVTRETGRDTSLACDPPKSIRWMRRVTDIQPIVLPASWRGKACVKPASFSAVASGRTKSGALSRPGTALSTSTAMWPRRWPPSRNITVRSATIPYGEGVLGLNRWRAVFADPKASAPAR